MTWEEMFAAIQCLSEASLNMRRPEEWYVSQPSVELAGDRFLRSVNGNGRTPQEAVLNHWAAITKIVPPSRFISVKARSPQRKNYLWNGYMWRELSQEDTGFMSGGERG